MPTSQQLLAAAINLHNAGQLREAEHAYQQVIAADPGNARAWHLWGVTAYQLHNFELAVNCAQRSLALKPTQADTHNNLGLAFHDLGMFDKAADSYQRALTFNPTYGIAHYNLGRALAEMRRLPEARACYQQALALMPDDADVHVSLALLALLAGDFVQGWREYEWRFKADATDEFALLQFQRPWWTGEPLSGKTVLLHSEQGLGDTIQFVRYVPLLKSLGATVLLGCKKPLRNLLASCPGVSRLVSDGNALPPFDFYAPLLSLPGVFNTTLNTIPATVPYLSADPSLVIAWRAKLAPEKAFRIGINWQGQGNRLSFRKRNIPIECFATLTSLPGTQYIRLQPNRFFANSDILTN